MRKVAMVVLHDIKSPDAWGELIHKLELPDEKSREFFEFGEYASIELEIDSELNVVTGRVLPLRKKR